MKHDNVMTIYGINTTLFSESAAPHSIVMPYMECGNIREFLFHEDQKNGRTVDAGPWVRFPLACRDGLVTDYIVNLDTADRARAKISPWRRCRSWRFAWRELGNFHGINFALTISRQMFSSTIVTMHDWLILVYRN